MTHLAASYRVAAFVNVSARSVSSGPISLSSTGMGKVVRGPPKLTHATGSAVLAPIGTAIALISDGHPLGHHVSLDRELRQGFAKRPMET